MILDLAVVFMKPAQRNHAEVDRPEPIVDLFEPNVFVDQEVTDGDAVRVPADPAIRTDFADFEVRRVFQQRQTPGIRPRRGGVEADGRALAQGFVRPIVVVLEPELIEPPLLTV